MASSGENYELTAPARMFFPNLLEPKAVVIGGKTRGDPKFSLNLALPLDHPDLLAMKKLCAKLALEKWPGRDIRNSGLAFPFTDGTALADRAKAKEGARECEFNRGLVIIPCRSKYPPKLTCAVNGKVTLLSTDDLKQMHADKFYSGADCYVVVNFLAYDKVDDRGFDGVTARLNEVYSLGTGARIGGAVSSASWHNSSQGHETAENPLAEPF